LRISLSHSSYQQALQILPQNTEASGFATAFQTEVAGVNSIHIMSFILTVFTNYISQHSLVVCYSRGLDVFLYDASVLYLFLPSEQSGCWGTTML